MKLKRRGLFMRGLHPIFMDNPPIPGNPLHPVHNDFLPDGPSAKTRAAMGQARRFAERMNLAETKPEPKLASTGYCLASTAEYLVYLPKGGEVTVNLSAARGKLVVEWFNPAQDKSLPGDKVAGGASNAFKAPFEGPAVLYLSNQP